MTLTKTEFVEKCLYMCNQTSDGLVKDIIRKHVKELITNPNMTASQESIPTDETILEYYPSLKTFPDFIYLLLCNMKLTREGIVKSIIGSDYDGISRKRRRVISDDLSDSDMSEKSEKSEKSS